ncbi:MAG: hypothetical protein GAK28_00836 [Luteibacter sp.]|nr:MAG: hypothetical protein GAK28_00836 [Luteibacter sp.]
MLSWRNHPVMDDGLSLVDAVRAGDHEEARFLSGRVLEQAEEAGFDHVASAVLALAPCVDGSAGRLAPTGLASLNLLAALLDVQTGFSARA